MSHKKAKLMVPTPYMGELLIGIKNNIQSLKPGWLATIGALDHTQLGTKVQPEIFWRKYQ